MLDFLCADWGYATWCLSFHVSNVAGVLLGQVEELLEWWVGLLRNEVEGLCWHVGELEEMLYFKWWCHLEDTCKVNDVGRYVFLALGNFQS